MTSLDGKVALVTGASRGLGEGVARALAKAGVGVMLVSRSGEASASVAHEIVAAGGRAEAMGCDVGDYAAVERTVAATRQRFGRLDILVNNAAFQSPVDKVEDLTHEQFQRTFATNIEATFFVTQAALAHMKEGSAVINTASITGLQGHKTLLDYSATKGAIITLTYSLAQALVDRNIRVNAVAPGPVWTPLIPATMDEEQVKGFGTDTPMGRAAQPDEIAPSYVFFASNRLSSYYSGEVLAPVGGQTMPG